MQTAHHVLLASHGTEGAQAAERMALSVCAEGAEIHHLIVVPDLWQGMTGDDWLNNGSTRDTYRRYLESELGREVDQECERLRKEIETQGLRYSKEIVVGKPDECLIKASKSGQYDLVVMGSPRPKGKKGLRSRMATKSLTGALATPLLVVPYPND